MISFELPGAPVTTNQGYRLERRGRFQRLVLSQEAAWYKLHLVRAAKAAARRAGQFEPIDRGAVIGIRFTFPTQGTDLDGACKYVIDSVASGSRGHPGAGLIVNDTRVRKLLVEKADCDGHPRTFVSVAGPDEPGCPTCGCTCRRLLP